MSASKRAKAARQAAHAAAKKQREYKKLISSSHIKNSTKKEFRELKVDYSYEDSTKSIPSFQSTSGSHYAESTGRKESKRYTGTLVRGIATMHKSNAVPVISQQEAEDISKMRRN
jgi:type II secretory pathway pseudopilin PulG